MEKDICIMIEAGAKGLVFGCLDSKGDVDVKQVTRLVSVAKNKQSTVELTFHRAIDMTRDLQEAANSVAQLGFDRILTSGGHSKALDGIDNIAALVKDLGDKVIVMPGGGICEDNLEEIQTKTKVGYQHYIIIYFSSNSIIIQIETKTIILRHKTRLLLDILSNVVQSLNILRQMLIYLRKFIFSVLSSTPLPEKSKHHKWNIKTLAAVSDSAEKSTV